MHHTKMNIDNKRITLYLVILIAFVIASTVFVLSNSLMDYEKSHGTSGVITDIVTDTDDEDEWEHIDLIVRKLAHVIEYALLGACVSVLALFIGCIYNTRIYGYVLAYSLFIAVLDEHIQSFSDRVSSTSDILLDFVGALFGGLFVMIIYFTVTYVLKRKNNAQPN